MRDVWAYRGWTISLDREDGQFAITPSNEAHTREAQYNTMEQAKAAIFAGPSIRVNVYRSGEATRVSTWSDFCRDNEGLDVAAIARVLDSGHAYTGGGGASCEFTISKV